MSEKTGKNCFVYGIIAFAFLLCTSVSWATDVSGTISTNTTWNSAGKPYIVTGEVTIEAGKTLTIGAGAEVKFNSGATLKVSGILNVSGTSASPAIFTLNQPVPSAGNWSGIKFDSGSVGNLNYLEVSYADKGIIVENNAPIITNCTIHHNNIGIEIYANAPPSVTYSTIRDNTTGIHAHADEYAGTPAPVVNHCSLFNNSEYNYPYNEIWS